MQSFRYHKWSGGDEEKMPFWSRFFLSFDTPVV